MEHPGIVTKNQDRYEREREFTDAAAEKTLSKLRDNLRLSNVGSFEELCEGIHYLRSVPDFYGNISGKRILEMGCGNGWVSLRFARSGADVWACDISPKMIELARRYAEAAHLDVTFETMVCEEMTYEDSFFDFVFMHMALHHCDIAATARQIRRVLKPGGKVVIVEDYAYHPVMRVYRALTPRKHTPDEHPLTDKDISLLVSSFSLRELEYSGLLNIFETSNNKLIRSVKPVLRWVDELLLDNLPFLRKMARLVVLEVVK